MGGMRRPGGRGGGRGGGKRGGGLWVVRDEGREGRKEGQKHDKISSPPKSSLGFECVFRTGYRPATKETIKG